MAFLIRFVHVGAASFLFGSALLVFVTLLLQRGRHDSANSNALNVMAAYEWVFWLCAGLLVLTGIGNLGALEGGPPGPETEWGRKLLIKLSLVAVILPYSAVRSCCVVLSRREKAHTGASTAHLFEVLYGGTALLIGGVVAMAVSLARF